MNVHLLFVLSPASLAALHRLIAILLALLDALAAPVDGAPRPFLTRLAIRAFSAYLERLAAHVTDVAGQAAADPAPPPPQAARTPRRRHTPPAPRLIRLPSWLTPAANPLYVEIERPAASPLHAYIVTIS